MQLDSLQVIHLRDYINKQEQDLNPLNVFKKCINPFAPMTCARHVYLFTDQGDTNTANLKQYLTAHSRKCEWLTGKDAYLFLLCWAVGSASHKLGANDHFVLGSIRKSWNDYLAVPTAPHTKAHLNLVHLMQMLFEDANHIRRVIQNLTLATSNKKELLMQMSRNCTASRSKEQKPAYDNLLADKQSYIETAQTTYLLHRFKVQTRKMRALNSRANDMQLLLPSMQTQMNMFKENLHAAFEKRALQAPDAAITEPTEARNLLMQLRQT